MKTATYTIGKVDSDGMVKVYRNGKHIGWAEEGHEVRTIRDMMDEDRMEYIGKLQEKIGPKLDDCEDIEKLEKILEILKG